MYKIITFQNRKIENEMAFVIGIAKNRLKKYYTFQYHKKVVPMVYNVEEEEVQIDLCDDIDLETDIITKDNVQQVWEHLKKKDVTIAKIFYLHYCLDMKIIDISNELKITESNVKNYLYRTLKELKEVFGKEKC